MCLIIVVQNSSAVAAAEGSQELCVAKFVLILPSENVIAML